MFEWVDTATDFMMGTAISVLSLVGLGPDEPVFTFDPLLAGLTEGCAMSPDLAVFREQLVADGTLIVPPGGEGRFTAAQIAVHDEYREIRVPVSGTWMDYELEAIAVLAGIDNGISSLAVVFVPGQEGLDADLAPLAAHADSILAADPENFIGASATFGTFQGRPQYVCDFST